MCPLEACADESFLAENGHGKPRLKRGHQYYFQIQRQLQSLITIVATLPLNAVFFPSRRSPLSPNVANP